MVDWVGVPGMDGYLVSSEGKIVSILGKHPRLMRTHWAGGRKDYLAVKLRAGGKTHGVYVHQIVAWAFLGPPPAGAWRIEFKDRDAANVRADNLVWAPKPKQAEKPWQAGARSPRNSKEPIS